MTKLEIWDWMRNDTGLTDGIVNTCKILAPGRNEE